ncbi:MAG: site-2 protease family protein [Candidatus Hinthialibacter sp.]
MIWQILKNPQAGIAMMAMLVLAISFHEMAHAWMALRRGDDTAARMGRLTLNPAVHFDPMGILFIMVATIGWGRPVPVNPLNLHDVRRDSMFIALAGPVSNILQALVLALLYRLLTIASVENAILNLPSGESILIACFLVTQYGVLINLALAFFNLIPLFPLDGEKILGGILPSEQAIKLEEFRQHSMMILFMLLAMGLIFGVSIIGFYFDIVVMPLTKLFLGFSLF